MPSQCSIVVLGGWLHYTHYTNTPGLTIATFGPLGWRGTLAAVATKAEIERGTETEPERER